MVYLLKMGGFSMAMLNNQMIPLEIPDIFSRNIIKRLKSTSLSPSPQKKGEDQSLWYLSPFSSWLFQWHPSMVRKCWAPGWLEPVALERQSWSNVLTELSLYGGSGSRKWWTPE
jgi:hypothetical protein